MLATRGSDDYGLVMALMAMLFCFPIGLTLLGFIIFSVSKLRSKKKLKKNQGKTVFIISFIIIVLSIIIPIAWMYSAKWHPLMVEVMLADFIPILVLAIISLVLSMRVKKRSLENDEIREERILKKEQTEIINKGLSKKVIIVLILFSVVIVVMTFLFFFTGVFY